MATMFSKRYRIKTNRIIEFYGKFNTFKRKIIHNFERLLELDESLDEGIIVKKRQLNSDSDKIRAGKYTISWSKKYQRYTIKAKGLGQIYDTDTLEDAIRFVEES